MPMTEAQRAEKTAVITAAYIQRLMGPRADIIGPHILIALLAEHKCQMDEQNTRLAELEQWRVRVDRYMAHDRAPARWGMP